jgi:hypothetical protein
MPDEGEPSALPSSSATMPSSSATLPSSSEALPSSSAILPPPNEVDGMILEPTGTNEGQ